MSHEACQPLRPQSAHPSLCPPDTQLTQFTHLSPGYQETRRSSLSASYTYQDPLTSPDTSGQDSEHGEVWQDIVRQLAVS